MPVHAVIPATIISHHSQNYENSRLVEDRPGAGPSEYRQRSRSYGATSDSSTSPDSLRRNSRSHEYDGLETIGEGAIYAEEEEGDNEDEEAEEVVELDVTWKHMSRLYLLVPVVTLIFLAGLILLVTFAWPPNERERRGGQKYPHEFLWKPLLVGIFASCTVQSIRVPIWEVVSSLNLSSTRTTLLSTTTHSILHELLRLASIPLIVPSLTSGFHSSYYLGLGWGIAETAWGIVQGWEQMSLYQDVMRRDGPDLGASMITIKPEYHGGQEDEERQSIEEEEDLERKVEVLERMRARRDLEDLIGVPFPVRLQGFPLHVNTAYTEQTIPFPLHLLWRLDTLLLNLGLTLLLSAFYFSPTPIYRHSHNTHAKQPGENISPYLWLAWALVAVLHVCLSLVWKVVGKVGVGAVTWGGLIVALGSVFAGLGGWGGLV